MKRFERLKTIHSRTSRVFFTWILSLFLRRKPDVELPVPPENICILGQEKLGDAILLIPLLKSLKQTFTGIHITVIASIRNYSLLKALSWIDETVILPKQPVAFFRMLKNRAFDLLYNPKDHPSRTYLLLMVCIQARCKVGYRHMLSDKFYHRPLPLRPASMIEQNMGLLSLYGVDEIPPVLPADLPVEKPDEADTFFALLHRPVIGLNLSAGSRIREWSTEKWESLIRQIQPDQATFFLTGLPGKHDFMKQLCNKYRHVTAQFSIQNLLQLNACIRNLDCLITPDTSVFHLGQLNGVQTIGLFQNAPANLIKFYRETGNCRLIKSPALDVASIPVDWVLREMQSVLRTGDHEDTLSE
jgi:heptosyltransferase-3